MVTRTVTLARVLAALAVVATVLVGAAGPVAAQPPTATPAPGSTAPGSTAPGSPSPAPGAPSVVPGQQDSTTYGFDEVCNQIHDGLSNIPVVGGVAGDVTSGVCKAGNVASHPGSALDATRSKLWDSTFGQVTDALLEGLGDALELSMAWVQTPNDTMLTGEGESSVWGRVDSYTRQLQIWVLAFSIAVSALRIGIARAHAAAEHAEETYKMLARSTLTTWIAGTAILAGARMTDSLSAWILTDVTGPNTRGAARLLVETGRFGFYSPGFIFLVALLGILGALSMTILTILRQALLVVAVGFYPLTAAATGTGGGKQAHERLGAWIIAFLLFKPVAALVYMIAFVTADTTATATHGDNSVDGAHRSLVALVLLCSAAFVLPALIRLVTPALSVLGSGGSAAGAAAAVGGAVAGSALLVHGRGTAGAGAGAGTAGHVAPPAANSPRPVTLPPPRSGPAGLPGPRGGSGPPAGLPPGSGGNRPGSGGPGRGRSAGRGAPGTAAGVGGAAYRTSSAGETTVTDTAGPGAAPPPPPGPAGGGPDLGSHRIDG